MGDAEKRVGDASCFLFSVTLAARVRCKRQIGWHAWHGQSWENCKPARNKRVAQITALRVSASIFGAATAACLASTSRRAPQSSLTRTAQGLSYVFFLFFSTNLFHQIFELSHTPHGNNTCGDPFHRHFKAKSRLFQAGTYSRQSATIQAIRVTA
jgi:hypothetical protein